MSVRHLMRENIQNLEPYRCARDEAGEGLRIYLDANENYAPLVDCDGINRYPDSSNLCVRRAVESVFGFPSDMVCAGNGSDELIDILLRIFCTPAVDSILVFPPTYGEYSVLASINDVRVIECPLEKDFSINLNQALSLIRAHRPKLVFICSPNNPTGNLFDRDVILTIARENPAVTVVDQAYVDFAPQGALTPADVEANERLVILRTLSKAWALAGARIGFMLSSREIASKCYDVKYPYNIPLPSQREAVLALSGREDCERRIRTIIASRKSLMERISRLAGVVEVLGSDANFFLVRFRDAGMVYSELKRRGIVVRDRSSNLHCEGCLRITVGSPQECDELVRALEEIL